MQRLSDPVSPENGMRVDSNGGGHASVPVVYPPSELGKQGISCEMGGPGMIPGGMPSGVPPSVYPMPVDAQIQQYMSRSMAMIPGECPRAYLQVSIIHRWMCLIISK